MSRGDIILRLVDVKRIYKTKAEREIVALNGVTTTFKRGEFVGVVGKSGSGKSTLINILGGLDTPDEGDYFLEGNNITKINEGQWDAIRNEKIGFIFQEYHLVEYLSVYKNVEIALKYQVGNSRKEKDAKIKDIIKKVGLIDHINKLPSQLSGGQRQRVAIARALVKDPAIILADEPTGALDYNTSQTVIELIKGLSKERLVIVVTHDRGIANEHATRIIELSEGKFTNDLIKEDIPQTYQNTYRKTEPTNLSFVDKLELTLRKIKSRFFRTLFTALSLALAFSFTILFNGIERGVTDAYDAYYEALNKANSYAFSLVSTEPVIDDVDYFDAQADLIETYNSYFDDKDSELVSGYSTDVIVSPITSGVEHVFNEADYPDLLNDFKLRLYQNENVGSYSYDDLFIGDSVYPDSNANEIMVTSKLYREVMELSDNVVNLNGYLNTTINLPVYEFTIKQGIFGVSDYLDMLAEDSNHDIVVDNPSDDTLVPIRYLSLNLPLYCYEYDQLNSFYQNRCEQSIRDQKYTKYFNSVGEFINYVDDFKTQVNKIDPDYFDMLLRSNAIYYLVDERDAFLTPSEPRYIERVYRNVYEEAQTALPQVEIRDAVFKSQQDTIAMTVTAIIDNENEAIIYMDQATYHSALFKKEAMMDFVLGYFSVNLESGILETGLLENTNQDDLLETIAIENFHDLLNDFSQYNGNNYETDFEIIRKEPIEQGEECAIYTVDNVLNRNSLELTSMVKDVFTVTDYSNCKINSEAYHYLNSIRTLFGVFFNALLIISIVFFNMLLKVILGERIKEIGIYRSVGATAKDIKALFFIEIMVEVIMAIIMSVVMIYYANELINAVFLDVINQGSGVISFAGIKLSIGDRHMLTNISFFNLIFYSLIVFALLGLLSYRNVTKLANTKPIDIIREVNV
ncbi:MAG: ABC transporter ATP-binding protein/permease [Candidatus Izimaplasma sp.]|nr:ABC transporter ATP-binding protein/permease [Candidatus Izimaplasma bacterium]